MRQNLGLPDPFDARVYSDPVVDDAGKDVFGAYVERCWLPHVGPSAFLVARRILYQPGVWDKSLLASAIGIGHRDGRNSTLEKALARLEAFHLAIAAGGVFYVRRYWPRLPSHLLAKLPPDAREAEEGLAAA
jgi:hypothetical protein